MWIAGKECTPIRDLPGPSWMSMSRQLKRKGFVHLVDLGAATLSTRGLEPCTHACMHVWMYLNKGVFSLGCWFHGRVGPELL